LMMLYARDILSRNPGSKIVYDVKCSSRLGVIISKLGGIPIMWKTGHSYLKSKLREEKAELAGDLSGHIFFQERWYGFDDGMYAAARLLEILMGMKQPPADILAKLPSGVCTPELRVEFPEGEHLAFMQQFTGSAEFAGAEISTIDGIRADFVDGWGLVRASNTTPALTLRFEAYSSEALARIQAEFKTAIHAVNPDLVLPF
jgi:phosphomannomutase/phosphoglucomutase